MKTEKEILQHCQDLEFLVKVPCDCPGTVHAKACEMGRQMMKSTTVALWWILEQKRGKDYQKIVDKYRQETKTMTDVIARMKNAGNN